MLDAHPHARAVLGSALGWFPLLGGYDVVLTPGWNTDFLGSALYHGVLPALTIVISSVGGWLLGTRNMMVSAMSEDYVLTARAKGPPSLEAMASRTVTSARSCSASASGASASPRAFSRTSARASRTCSPWAPAPAA